MFGGQFSHTRFGLPSSDDLEIVVSASFSDTLKEVTGFGVVTTVEEAFFDGLNTSARATASLPTKFQSSDSLKGNFDALGGVTVSFAPMDMLLARVDAVINPAVSENFTWELNASIWATKDIIFGKGAIYAKDELTSTGYASKDIVHAQVLTDMLNAYASTVILYITTVFVDVSIPPGGTLEIDSDTYDVILNGENILNLHSGEWLFFDRSIVTVSVDSGTGGVLEGKVLYKERYL